MSAATFDVSHAIQLSVAPVFLLTGLGALLNVITNRLGRMVDRGRDVEATWPRLSESEQTKARVELRTLANRARLASSAINAFTVAALLVCLVIALLFVDALLGAPHLRWIVAALFIAMMIVIIVGLAVFLREVELGTRHLKIAPPG